jgi:hypothetical protein
MIPSSLWLSFGYIRKLNPYPASPFSIFSPASKNGINILTINDREQVLCCGTESRAKVRIRHHKNITFAAFEIQVERGC